MLLTPAKFPLWYKIFILVTLALFVVNLFTFLPTASAVKGWLLKELSADKVLSALGTLIATFIGAWLAFSFAKKSREQTRQDEQVASGNLALFTITRMFSQSKQYEKEIISPYRAREDAWLNLPVSTPLNSKLGFEVKDLSFIAELYPLAFQALILEEERFRIAAYMVEEHRALALEQTWPRLAEAGIKVAEGRPEAEIEKILGPSIVKQLKVTTAAIIKNFDENIISLEEAFVEVRKALKAVHSTRRFINFKFDK